MARLTLNMSMIGSRNTGLGVYALGCRKELKKFFSCTEVLSQIDLPDVERSRTILSPKGIVLGASRYANIYRIGYLSRLAFRKDLGFVYTPTHHGLPGYKEQIITLHDIICIHHPEQYRAQYWYFKYILPFIIKTCKAVITVSHTSKEEICRYYHLSPDFVYVVPNALQANTIIEDRRNERYLLAVGASYRHKNIHELILNAEIWKKRYRLKIVSAGGEYCAFLNRVIREQGVSDIVDVMGFVSEEELHKLYAGCSALVYPSLWEGFGIPPLEAMRFGKPAILSDIGIFREIFQDAAIYITLGNNDSWKTAFDILGNEQLLQRIRKRQTDILNQYSWSKNGILLKEILLALEPCLHNEMK